MRVGILGCDAVNRVAGRFECWFRSMRLSRWVLVGTAAFRTDPCSPSVYGNSSRISCT